MENIFQVMEKRSSTRAYQPEKLTGEELEALLKAALQAPTATNRQEIHITVLEKGDPILAEIEAEKNALFGAQAPVSNFYYDAPTVLLLSADKAFSWGTLDAGIAVENIALAAEGLGLGSVIIGCIRDALNGPKADSFAKALRFPEGYKFEIAIALGHKAKEKLPHEYDLETHVTRL